MGLDFVQMSKEQQLLVVHKADISFRYPVQYNVRRVSHYHLEAEQDIYLINGKAIFQAKVVVVGIEGGDKFQLPKVIIDTYPLVKKMLEKLFDYI